MVPFVLIVMNLVWEIFVLLLAETRKPVDETENMKNTISSISIFQLLTMVLIIPAVNLNVKLEGADAFLGILDGKFDDYNTRFFMHCAPQLLALVFFQLLVPHFIPLALWVRAKVARAWDRGCTCNFDKSRHIIQSKYEALYIGPEFLLEQRLGQVVALVWVTFALMPAIPTLPMILVPVLLVMFWVDKVLVLRFYRTPQACNEDIILLTVRKFKWAFLWHGVMGAWMLSNPSLLSSDPYNVSSHVDAVDGLLRNWSGGKMFVPERFGQVHVVLFLVVMLVLCFMLAFETLLGVVLRGLGVADGLYVEAYKTMEAISDDFYQEISAESLVREYRRAVRNKRELMEFIAHAHHQPDFEAHRTLIKEYLARIIEKEDLLAAKLKELCARLGTTEFTEVEDRCHTVLARQHRANLLRGNNMTSKI